MIIGCQLRVISFRLHLWEFCLVILNGKINSCCLFSKNVFEKWDFELHVYTNNNLIKHCILFYFHLIGYKDCWGCYTYESVSFSMQ